MHDIARSVRRSGTGMLGLLAGVMATGMAVSTANAAVFDVFDAGITLENTIPDLDLFQITQFVGVTPATLTYGVSITAAGFTASMSGTYAGQSLNVSYTGDLSAFPGGPVTWTASGAYGARTLSGSGTATFTFPTSSTFTEAYVSSLVLGVNTGSANLTIDGEDSPVITYTSAVGSVAINGVANDTTYPTYRFELPTTDDDVCHGILRNGKCIGEEEIVSADVVLTGPPDVTDTGTISVVPEPGSAGIFMVAILSLLCFARGWKRR
jgi:hypothetical protein